MGKKSIVSVGVRLPGITPIPFKSKQALLDADIVFFYPCLDKCDSEGWYFDGRYSAHDHSILKDWIRHWREELDSCMSHGKLVVVPLAKPLVCVGESGNYQSQRELHTTSYDSLPVQICAELKTGKQMTLDKGVEFLRPYWKALERYSNYEVMIEGSNCDSLVLTKTGNRVVGGHLKTEGHLLLVPNLKCPGIKFGAWQQSEPKWGEEALEFGKRLTTALLEVAQSLTADSETVELPNWLTTTAFSIGELTRIAEATAKAEGEIKRYEDEIEQLNLQKKVAARPLALLHAQGKQLETAVIDALATLGFEAERYADADSEFDVVFTSAEGRCLAEVEGKDNSPINIDKHGQLERNIAEDLERDEVLEPAKGVLFGNAFRHLPIEQRSNPFTAKCYSAAKRTKTALVRTSDLFHPVCYLKESSDADYAAACRRAIVEAEGELVQFPELPNASELKPMPKLAQERIQQLSGLASKSDVGT